MPDIFIARQPIYDRTQQVRAYELLFRHDNLPHAAIDDADRATSQVLLNALTEFGLPMLAGGLPAFINVTETILLTDALLPLGERGLVLEVPAEATLGRPLLDAVVRHRQAGHHIAIDHCVYSPELEPLLALADFVKVDLTRITTGEIWPQTLALRPFPGQLLADKVETPAVYEICRDAGFELFQGYQFARPDVLHGRRAPTSLATTLQLLRQLEDPEVEIGDLEQVLNRDPLLSYQLLRYVNSAFFAIRRELSSVREAIIYLGLEAVRSWAVLLAMSGNDDKPHELMKTALVRARMCEFLAPEKERELRDRHFTVGLFSTLDAMLDTPLEEALAELPLHEEVVDALLRHEGEAGQALATVLAYERGDWEHLGPAPEHLGDHYLAAVRWAEEACHCMHG